MVTWSVCSLTISFISRSRLKWIPLSSCRRSLLCTLVYSSFKDDCECAGIDCELWLWTWMCRHSAYFRVDPHPRTHPGLPEVSFYNFKIFDWSDSFQIWDILFIANFKTWIVWTLFRYRISFFYHFKIWIGRTLFKYGISFFLLFQILNCLDTLQIRNTLYLPFKIL